jgi:hypothetical protein
MQSNNFAFGGGAAVTMIHPLVVLGTIIAIMLICTLPHRKVIVPLLVSIFMIPLAQVVLIGPLHFPILRILIMAGLARMIVQGGTTIKRGFPQGFNQLDKIVVLWIVSTLIIGSLRWMDEQAFIKLSGDCLDSMGGYLVLRFFIPDSESVRRSIQVLALICMMHGMCMVSEQFTHRNTAAFMGAFSPTIRNGHLRSEGIMGTLFEGTFGGVSIPMFLWLCTDKGSKKAGVVGLIGATAMVVASHASTSFLAYGSGLLGLCCWPLRKLMRYVRYGIVVILIGLHLVMNGPVWSLIEKVDITGGSSSYHRYMLVDNCIRHFSDWWLIGTKEYGNWGFVMWDLCNQFVVAALTGGLITLILFIMVYSRGFGAIGERRIQVDGNNTKECLLWCLGSTLFANVVASFGINYMIQLQIVLFVYLTYVTVAVPKPIKSAARSVNTWSSLILASEGHITQANMHINNTNQ